LKLGIIPSGVVLYTCNTLTHAVKPVIAEAYEMPAARLPYAAKRP